MLETERLVLRHLTLGDLDELAALYRDPEVRRYFPDGTLTYEERGRSWSGASTSMTAGMGTGCGRRSARTGTS